MKKWIALYLIVLLLAALLPVAGAETTLSISDKNYNVEVRSIDVVTSLDGVYRVVKTAHTTGRKLAVNSITLEYDFEAEQAETVGRFEEDVPMALVCVDGFAEEISGITDLDDVAITINGMPIGVEDCADYAEYVGWQNVNKDGAYSVVFPLALTKAGGEYAFTVRVQALIGTKRMTETAQIAVKLVNTHVYKAEREARIAMIEGEHVDAYVIGERIYLDHPRTASGTPKVTISFADENGLPFDGITWVEQSACKEEAEKAALYLKEEVRLDEDSAAAFELDSGCAEDRRKEVVFKLETWDAMYETPEYTIVERFDVEMPDPKGVYFAQSERVMRVGQVWQPLVLGIKTNAPVYTTAAGTLQILNGNGTDAQVLDVTDGKTVIATKPGVAYITARYVMGQTVYEAASMKIVVTETAAEAKEYSVLCRNLNVRAAAGTDAEKVGMLHRGDCVQVIAIENGWARLIDGTFVAAQYIG